MNMSSSKFRYHLPLLLIAVLVLPCSACLHSEQQGKADQVSAAANATEQTLEYLDVGFGTVYAWSATGPARPVRISGRLHRCDGSEQWLPATQPAQAGELVLYRYVLACCPGHSVPAVIGLSVLPEGTAALEQDAWVELSGSLRLSEQPGGMPQLEIDHLERIAAPENALEQLNPPSKMGAPCAGSRPDIPYPPR
ncbi:MAG: hypothetical protein R3F46_02920 [bacterium]